MVDVLDTCRDHRCLTTVCQKQHKQNDPASSGRHSYQGGGACDGGSRTDVGYKRHLKNCQKQHRQNELAGQVDISTRVEVRVMGDPRHV